MAGIQLHKNFLSDFTIGLELALELDFRFFNSSTLQGSFTFELAPFGSIPIIMSPSAL